MSAEPEFLIRQTLEEHAPVQAPWGTRCVRCFMAYPCPTVKTLKALDRGPK